LYQTHNEEYNLGQTSFECGRRNNSLKLWTMWKAIGTKGIANIINYQFNLAKYAREYVKNSSQYKLYSFEDSLSICFNYKQYDPVDLCTKLYEFNKLMIGFGYFGSQSFIRLVIINSSNTQKEIKEFFEIIEDFTKKNHDSIRTITSK
jgi:sulfinoalanine decarboxylase/sulfinoalanine decarboxylase/aspartate 1-decarboxylase